MKTPLTALTLLGVMATSPAWAQTGSPAVSGATPRNGIFSGRGAAAKAAPKKDAGVTPAHQIFPNSSSMPDLTAPDDLKTTMDLPSDPIEPWLLTKEAGPFMVSAKTFRGVDADRMALALAKELRNKHGLPAYILRTKDFPGKSRIRGLPPTADPQVAQASTAVPEKYRTFDEAAVLVGDCKTEKESLELLHKVKKIKPDCLNEMAKIFTWREGLSHAIRTANPYVAAQHLYPKKQDKLIVQMNDSPLSVANCPGRYTLQIAMFSGRATFNEKDEQFQGILNLKKSPLATAADDAEKLAAKLSKNPEFRKLGVPVYVYHDRTSSRVFVGAFNAPNDPSAGELRNSMLNMAIPLVVVDKKKPSAALDTLIAPAGMLSDLQDIKANFTN